MSISLSDTVGTSVSSSDSPASKVWFALMRDPQRVAITLFFVTVAFMFMYRPFSKVEEGDSALYDYIAQSIVRGQTPYKDVIDIKAPGSFYLSALAMKAGRVIGVRDIIAARMLHIALTAFLLAVVYLVAEYYLRNRFAALVAALFLLNSEHLAGWTVGGGQPKLPMILFGMLTLLLIAKDRPFVAGFCSMLSCLCWQPGLLFTGVAFLVFSRYFTTWRDLKVLKLLAGAAIPLAILLIYFYSRGALDDLWTWTVAFNYSIYARKTLEGAGNSLSHLLNVSLKIFKVDIVLVVMSLIGFGMFATERLRKRLKAMRGLKSPELFHDAIVIAPLTYLAACLVRFNAGPYLIPFLPFIGIFFGWFIVESVRLAKKSSFLSGIRKAGKVDWLPNAVLASMFILALCRGVADRLEFIPTLQHQNKEIEAISSLLADSETIYVHGTIEVLVLLNKPNLNPYVFLDWGKDDYVAAKNYGGRFEAIIDEIESSAPKIVVLSRLQRVSHREELRQWVEQHYHRLDLAGYDVYVRN